MGYLLYLAGMVVCVLWGISSERLGNFIDMTSFEFVVIPSILLLVCTGYGKDFIRAFICLVKKEACTKKQIKSSAKAVKMVCVSSLIFGGLGVVISLINALHSFNIDLSAVSFVAPDVSVALISIFYALLINAVLAPVYVMVKRLSLGQEEKAEVKLQRKAPGIRLNLLKDENE